MGMIDEVLGKQAQGGTKGRMLGFVALVTMLDFPGDDGGATFRQLEELAPCLFPWLPAVRLLERVHGHLLGRPEPLHVDRILVPVPAPCSPLDTGG